MSNDTDTAKAERAYVLGLLSKTILDDPAFEFLEANGFEGMVRFRYFGRIWEVNLSEIERRGYEVSRLREDARVATLMREEEPDDPANPA